MAPGVRTAVRRIGTSTVVALASLAVLLGTTTALATMLLPDDADPGDEALAGGTGPAIPPFGNGADRGEAARSRSMSEPSSTTTSTGSTTSTTTTPLVVTDPPTTTTSQTTQPTTTTSTTAPPGPVIDAFQATTERGCGPGRSSARITWSTTHATSATLGRLGGSSSGVPVDGQLTDVCVDDDGETWRLTASGPGGTTTRDLTVDP